MSNNSTGFGTGPPPGPVENLGPQAEAITWVLVAITGLFLGLRLYCKWIKSKNFWWDDYLLMISWIFLLIDGVILHYNVKIGFGKHVWYLAMTVPQNLTPISFNSYLAGTFSILAAVWSKTSFAITLLRIAEAKWFKIVIWVIIVTMNIAMTLNAIFAFAQCNPVEKVWNIDLPGSCWHPNVYAQFGVWTGVYSGLMDIALALLPWQIIWGLQMKKTEKFGVAIAMSMGLVAGATAFVKSSQIPALAKGDFTFDGYGLIVWGSCEVAMTIIAACIPVLRVLVRDVKNSTRMRNYGSAASGNGTLSKSGGDTTTSRSNAVVVTSGGNTRSKTGVTKGVAKGVGRRGSTSFSRPFGGGGATTTREVHGDDWSERSIFHDDNMNNKILHTQEIKVEYHNADSSKMGHTVGIHKNDSTSSSATNSRDRSRDRGAKDEYEMGRMV